MALMILIDKIAKSLENGDFFFFSFLDFSNTFDTVNHEILLYKPTYHGIKSGSQVIWEDDLNMLHTMV